MLGANAGGWKQSVFTKRIETHSNGCFANLLDMCTALQRSATDAGMLEGRDRQSGELMWTGTVADLVFGSNSQLRALAEVYASGGDAQASFVADFVAT